MKILYVTDMHGYGWKYYVLLQLAKKHKVDMVINGGDMLPKGDSDFQKRYVVNYLDKHFSQFNNAKIYYLCCLGNDDLRVVDKLFQDTCDEYPFIFNLSQVRVEIDDYEFIGFNLVTDYPFRLKDRCRRDDIGYVFPKQYGTGLLSSPDGTIELNDWIGHAKSIPTIKDELLNLVPPKNMSKTVYVMHNPPSDIKLDVCHDKRKVGSRAIYDFLEKQQPLLSLHGHIHESPNVTGIWHGKIGKTICIQPGQLEKMTYVIINLDTGYKKRYLIDWDYYV